MLSIVRILLLGGLVGKLLGIFRELLSAWLFGTGLIASAFRLSQSAFLIPLHGFVSDAVNGGFMPNFSVWMQTDKRKALALFSSLNLVIFITSVTVSVLLYVFAKDWVLVLAPGFSDESVRLSSSMVRVLSIALPAYALVTLYAATDLVINNGALSAARASIQSIGLITGTTVAWYLNEPLFIAWGFDAAYFSLLIWGVYTTKKQGLELNPFGFEFELIKDVLLKTWGIFKVLIWIPIVLQLNQVVERRVASLLDPDAIAALDYSKFISDTLIILVAVPFAFAGQARMAGMSEDEFKKQAIWSVNSLLLFGIPLTIMLFLNSEYLIRTVFQRGAFNEKSVFVTTQILSYQAIGVFAGLIGYASLRFLNARGQNKDALNSTLIGAIFGVAINYFLYPYFGLVILGIANASMLVITAIISIYKLKLFRDLSDTLIFWAFISFIYFLIYYLMRLNFSINLLNNFLLSTSIWAIMFIFSKKIRADSITLIKDLKS